MGTSMQPFLFLWVLYCFLWFHSECFRSIQGTRCDVREGEDVKDLVAFAQEKLKCIDIWVSNLNLISALKT